MWVIRAGEPRRRAVSGRKAMAVELKREWRVVVLLVIFWDSSAGELAEEFGPLAEHFFGNNR